MKEDVPPRRHNNNKLHIARKTEAGRYLLPVSRNHIDKRVIIYIIKRPDRVATLYLHKKLNEQRA